jgi:alanyl-tRNA synthetase
MKATIIEVKKDTVVLSDSFFRVAGGGQPCDFGRIFSESFEAMVIDVIQQGDVLLHTLKVTRGHAQQGMQVKLELDMKRRAVLTRMHTAEHVLFKSLKSQYPSLELEKIDLGVEESCIYAHCDALNWEHLFLAEKKANEIVRLDLPITERLVPKEQALDFFDIRIKPERIKEEMVRVIEVQGFDISACSGTHCKNTSEIGSIFITRYNAFGPGRWQISFTVHEENIFESAAIARQATALLSCDSGQVLGAISNLLAEKDSYKEHFRSLSRKYLLTLSPEAYRGVSFYAQLVLGFEPKQLQEAATEILSRDKNAVIVFVASKQAFVFCSPGVRNAKHLLDVVLVCFSGRGGGRDTSAQGGFVGDPSQVLVAFKEAI